MPARSSSPLAKGHCEGDRGVRSALGSGDCGRAGVTLDTNETGPRAARPSTSYGNSTRPVAPSLGEPLMAYKPRKSFNAIAQVVWVQRDGYRTSFGLSTVLDIKATSKSAPSRLRAARGTFVVNFP